MGENKGNVKKICSFYVSNWHLVTMLLPYINRSLEKGNKFTTILEENLNENIKALLSNINLNKNDRTKIEQINWKENKLYKYSDVEELIDNEIKKSTNINILVTGKKEFIQNINSNINKWLDRNYLKISNNNIYINIINCYEVMQFNNNIKEILDLHDTILNTSGEKQIAEVFEGYLKPNENLTIVNE